jgi:hypothetical protein
LRTACWWWRSNSLLRQLLYMRVFASCWPDCWRVARTNCEPEPIKLCSYFDCTGIRCSSSSPTPQCSCFVTGIPDLSIQVVVFAWKVMYKQSLAILLHVGSFISVYICPLTSPAFVTKQLKHIDQPQTCPRMRGFRQT